MRSVEMRHPASLSKPTVRRGLAVLCVAAVFCVVSAGPAAAYWMSSGAGTGVVPTATFGGPTGVTVPSNSLSSVQVSWTAPTGPTTPTGYYVQRTTGGVTTAACGSSPGSTITGISCVDTSVADGTYTYTVTDVYRSWAVTSAPSGTVTVVTATQVVFTGQPSNTVAGTTITPGVAVTVETSTGAAVPIAGISVTVAIGTNPAGGALSGTLTHATNTSGVATFGDLSLNKAGVGYTLTATSGSLTGATSNPFTITAAAPATLLITSAPVSGTASATATLGPITVAERDAFGNVAVAPTGGTAVTLGSNSAGTPGFAPTFATTSGGTATTTVTIAAGTSSAFFYYGDPKAGTPTLTAAHTGLASAVQSETIIAGTATQLMFGQEPTNTAKDATIISGRHGPDRGSVRQPDHQRGHGVDRDRCQRRRHSARPRRGKPGTGLRR